MFASLGIFPNAGTASFIIGSPRVSKASLVLKQWNGRPSKLEIIVHDNSDENLYIEKLLVNGNVWNSSFIDRSVLVANGGATLEFFMHSNKVSGLCT